MTNSIFFSMSITMTQTQIFWNHPVYGGQVHSTMLNAVNPTHKAPDNRNTNLLNYRTSKTNNKSSLDRGAGGKQTTPGPTNGYRHIPMS